MRVIALSCLVFLAVIGGCTLAETPNSVPIDKAETIENQGDTIEEVRDLPNGYSQAGKDQCLADGGAYQRVGMAGRYNCITPYADAGKICRASADCEGQCRVDMESEEGAPGKCQANTNPFGCYAFYNDDGQKVGICVD